MLQSCVFCNINVAKNCCKDFEIRIKWCNVNVARILENDQNVAKTKYCNYMAIHKHVKKTWKLKWLQNKIAGLVKKLGAITTLFNKYAPPPSIRKWLPILYWKCQTPFLRPQINRKTSNEPHWIYFRSFCS